MDTMTASWHIRLNKQSHRTSFCASPTSNNIQPVLGFYFASDAVHFWHREDTLQIEQENNGEENLCFTREPPVKIHKTLSI